MFSVAFDPSAVLLDVADVPYRTVFFRFIRGRVGGHQPKQRSPDFPLTRHFVFPGDPEAFSGQPRDLVSPACPGSSPGSPTGGTGPEHLNRKASGRHPD